MDKQTKSQAHNHRDAILQQLAQIPHGHVTTYGAIAKAAGLPGYARFVGQVLRKLPKDTKLPWHRVVNAQAKLSFPLLSSAYLEQKTRLQREGVELHNDKINFRKYRDRD